MSRFKEWLEYFDDIDADVYAYFGPISHMGYDQITESFPAKKRKNALLILGTWGGSPDAGFRVARAMQHHYEDNFRVLVPYFCKSAGTLICIGASQLYLCDKSELGPLDVQIRKQDEMFQQNSGLDIVRGVTFITEDALEKFREYLLDINGGSGMSTKTAAEVASKLVIGLYEPIFAQVDPVKLGETNAALSIAANYGERLNKTSGNLLPKMLSRLIHGYPSHGFVIDRSEAKSLFKRVEKPDEKMGGLGHEAQKLLWANDGFALNVLYLNKAFEEATTAEEKSENPEENHEHTNNTDDSNVESTQHATDGAPGAEEHAQGHAGSEHLEADDSREPSTSEKLPRRRRNAGGTE